MRGIANDYTSYVGKTIGKLTIHEILKERDSHRNVLCTCSCSCNCERIIRPILGIIRGTISSCGKCGVWLDSIRRSNSKWKGKYPEKLVGQYYTMKTRCYNPNFFEYENYGGRGITICKEWLDNPELYYQWAISHGYREGLTLERINNDLGYSPQNCVWTTRLRQSHNKRNNRQLTVDGVTMTQQEWSREVGLPAMKISRADYSDAVLMIEHRLHTMQDFSDGVVVLVE